MSSHRSQYKKLPSYVYEDERLAKELALNNEIAKTHDLEKQTANEQDTKICQKAMLNSRMDDSISNATDLYNQLKEIDNLVNSLAPENYNVDIERVKDGYVGNVTSPLPNLVPVIQTMASIANSTKLNNRYIPENPMLAAVRGVIGQLKIGRQYNSTDNNLLNAIANNEIVVETEDGPEVVSLRMADLLAEKILTMQPRDREGYREIAFSMRAIYKNNISGA